MTLTFSRSVIDLQNLSWPAPAKLNLMLRVVGRRKDGYHLLQTVFQFLEIGDRLTFKVREDGVIKRTRSLQGVSEEQDLVLRAAYLMRRHARSILGVEIDLKKYLPLGAGLGGGSSDAATVLVALNRLWRVEFSNEKLAILGLALGADVPVFVNGRAAWAEGVGDQLTPLELDEPWYLVIRPACSVVTGEVFSAPDLTRNSQPIKIADFLAGNAVNDCLPVVRRNYPEVAEALDWLAGFGVARLTGTGSCVFAAFTSEASAEAVLEQLPAKWRGLVARGRNRSPLLDSVEGKTSNEPKV